MADLSEQLQRKEPTTLDYSMLRVPQLQVEAHRRRWIRLDIETGLYFMIIPFALFTTEDEYERAVNSFQLDESLLAMIATLTGDMVFRTWTPLKFTPFLRLPWDVPRDLFWHSCVSEYAHERLCRIEAGKI